MFEENILLRIDMIARKQMSRRYHAQEERLYKGASARPEDFTDIWSCTNRSREFMNIQHPSKNPKRAYSNHAEIDTSPLFSTSNT